MRQYSENFVKIGRKITVFKCAKLRNASTERRHFGTFENRASSPCVSSLSFRDREKSKHKNTKSVKVAELLLAAADWLAQSHVLYEPLHWPVLQARATAASASPATPRAGRCCFVNVFVIRATSPLHRVLSFSFCFVVAIMTGRTWATKFATKHRFGSRKRKPPNIRKTSRPSRNVPAPEPASDTVDVLPNTPQAVTALCSSGDYTPNVDAFSDACLPAAPRGCAATPADSTAAVTEVNSESVVPAPTSTGTENEPCSRNSRTIQVHQEPQFISSEELNVTAATVRESLCSVPATERKFRLTADGGSSAAADSNEFLLVQISALNSLLSKTLCHHAISVFNRL